MSARAAALACAVLAAAAFVSGALSLSTSVLTAAGVVCAAAYWWTAPPHGDSAGDKAPPASPDAKASPAAPRTPPPRPVDVVLDVRVVQGQEGDAAPPAPPAGFRLVEGGDLNAGGGRPTYLAASFGPATPASPGVTGVWVVYTDDGDGARREKVPRGFRRVRPQLSEEHGGRDAYLVVRHGGEAAPVVDLRVVPRLAGATPAGGQDGWVVVPKDANKGTGGPDRFVAYRRAESRPAPADGACVTDVRALRTDAGEAGRPPDRVPQGYSVAGGHFSSSSNLNHGTDGREVHLYCAFGGGDGNETAPVTAVCVVRGTGPGRVPDGFEVLPRARNLNAGNDGQPLYLGLAREPGGEAVREVVVVTSGDVEAPDGFFVDHHNVNEGAGSLFRSAPPVHVCWR